MTNRNRRRFQRLPMRGFLMCHASFQTGGRTRRLPVLSLSAGGMYVALEEREHFDLERGDQLSEIRFDIGELETLRLEGCVAHRMSLGEIGGCGVEFGPDVDHDLIDGFVRGKLLELGLGEH